MKTRKQFVQGQCTHHQYYSQFVTSSHLTRVRNIGIDAPLNYWDALGPAAPRAEFKKYGDSYTSSGQVCIWKTAKRMQMAMEKSVINLK